MPDRSDTDVIYIPFGEKLNLDMDVDIRVWVIEGSLRFDPGRSTTMKGEMIIVNGGVFTIGTESEPFQHEAKIELLGNPSAPVIPVFGKKVLAVTHGSIGFYGRTATPLTRLVQPASAGDQSLLVTESARACGYIFNL